MSETIKRESSDFFGTHLSVSARCAIIPLPVNASLRPDAGEKEAGRARNDSRV